MPPAERSDPERASAAWRRRFAPVATLEFTRERKSMGVIARKAGGGPGAAAGGSSSACSLFVKGAPESVLARCTSVLVAGGRVVPMSEALHGAILSAVLELAGGEALRCLACAVRHDLPPDISSLPLADPARFAEIESDLTFAGLVGLHDPPRPEVADAIRRCAAAREGGEAVG